MRVAVDLTAAAVALLGVDLLIAGELAGASLGAKLAWVREWVERVFAQQAELG